MRMIVNWALKMNHSSVQLMNLPDELLLIILKKLDTVDVLLSLMGSVVRLDQIVRDPCFTAEIDLIKLHDDERCAQADTCIDRFCSDILPVIHHQIKWLKVQSTLMERILLAADYNNLSQLDIFIPHEEPILRFNGESTLAFSSVRSSSVHEHTSTLVQVCERRFFLSLSLSPSLYTPSMQDQAARKIDVGFDARMDDHCHHIAMVHHTTLSKGSTTVLFWFRWIISHPSIQRSNLDNIS